jgi:hypothetical protein
MTLDRRFNSPHLITCWSQRACYAVIPLPAKSKWSILQDTPLTFSTSHVPKHVYSYH